MMILSLILYFIQGIIVGFGAIMPGISGGTLCVAFQMYYPIMAILSSFKDNIVKYGVKVSVFIFGGIVGFLGLSSIAAYFLEKNSVIMIALFIGFISGTLPSLFDEAKLQGRNRYSYIGLLSGFILMMILLEVISKHTLNVLNTNFIGYFISGVLWGLSFIVPGLSSSTLLLYFGIYSPMLKGISHFDLSVIIPLGLGTIASVLLLARIVNMAYKHYYNLLSHIILGIIISTLVKLVPIKYSSLEEFVYCIVLFLVGSIISYYLTKLCTYLKVK